MSASRVLAVLLAVFALHAGLVPGQELGVEEEVRRHLGTLASPDPEIRDAAEDSLVSLGDAAARSLPPAGEAADPEIEWRLERVRRRIRLALGRDLLDLVHGLLDDFEERPFRGRIERLALLVRVAGEASLPALEAVAANDPHAEVRRRARRMAGELDLGIRVREAQPLLAAGDYAGAVRRVEMSLSIDPEAPLVHYQIACYLSLAGRVDDGIAALERACALGFTNFYHMEEDPELARLRADPRFEELRARYEEGPP